MIRAITRPKLFENLNIIKDYSIEGVDVDVPSFPLMICEEVESTQEIAKNLASDNVFISIVDPENQLVLS